MCASRNVAKVLPAPTASDKSQHERDTKLCGVAPNETLTNKAFALAQERQG
jgi:hypothetical protein